MIAYHVLCHDNLAQVARLVESLLAPGVHVLIDIDDGGKPDIRALERVARLPNVRVKRDANIGWGGAGTMRKTLAGALELLDAGTWNHYVVLSGQDLPIASNDRIHERLARDAQQGTSHLRCHAVEPVALADQPVKNAGVKPKFWEDRGHTRLWALPGVISPHVEMDARRLVDVTEVGERGEVFVGPMDSLLARRRDDFFARHPLYAGPNWFDLHRSFVEHLRTDPFAYELYDVVRTTFIPDECYFQTYAMNSPFRDRIDSDYLRLIVRPQAHPAPKVFDNGDREVIAASDALFARKFDTRHDAHIVDTVLEARAA